MANEHARLHARSRDGAGVWRAHDLDWRLQPAGQHMGALLRGRFWILEVVVAGACAALLGHAVAGAWLPPVVTPAPVAAPAERGAGSATARSTSAIVSRNIFCSTCPPLEGSAPVPVLPADPSPRRSRLPVDLVAVNVAVQPFTARWSSAVLRDRATRRVGRVAVGGTIAGARVTGISGRRVDLLNEGKKEYLDLLGEEHDPDLDKRAGSEEAPSAPGPRAPSGIRKTGARSYEIARATLEDLLSDVGGLARVTRALPETSEGRVVGFRLMGVQADGPLARLGIQSGDMISAINGLPLASVEQALVLYTKLKSASHLAVALVRGGRRMELDYTVR